MKQQEIRDLTGMVISVDQWSRVLADKAGDLDTVIEHSERGAPLTESEREAIETLYGHLRIAVEAFQYHIRAGQDMTGRPLPDDWKSRRIQ
jgi:hypothetical protein